jgi:hypothetical protein
MVLANRYLKLRDPVRVQERALFPLPRNPSELELQARWFAGDFGRQFRSTANDEIEVVQFGTWNRAAGPDFSDAAIRINSSEPCRGSIEFDLSDRSWEAHGHAVNPAFEDVVLHVFVQKGVSQFFTRTRGNRNVPQIQVNPDALPDAFSASIPLARPGRCQAPLKDLSDHELTGVLDAAAQFRLQRKTARLKIVVENRGRDEALFQEIAAALGYKENKLPFTLLAQRLPLRLLHEQRKDAEAMLFGVAGFLEGPDLAVYPRETHIYLRDLWERWWPHRAGMQRLVLPSKVWRLSGARPLNHPQRRLGALAALVESWSAFTKSIAPRSVDRTRDFFLGLHHPFWNFHYTLGADPTAGETALVGEARIADILANVLIPFFLAEGCDVWPAYNKLTARLSNRRLETAATRLFGDDPRRAPMMKTVAHQQGLLQIYEDFCLQDNSDCAHCPFPEQMRKWK